MVERIYGVCLRHARRVLPGDPALEPADLLHQAYLLTATRLDALATDRDRTNYLCRAITNLAIGHARRLLRHPRAPLHDAHFAPDDPAAEAELAAAVDAALATPRLGLAECALHGLGYDYAEIGALRGITQGAAKTRMFRCREAYRGDD
jgi:DNA-directed RNA polymerase specialized sigma24 family protein